jgi:hypothetical protein
MDIGMQVSLAILEAKSAAAKATAEYLAQNGDGWPCGFAWVHASVKGNTRIGKALMANGFQKSYGGGLQWWNPSDSFTQNMGAKEHGARVAARVLSEKLGESFYAQSRMD